MTDDRLPLAELMAKTGDGHFLRSVRHDPQDLFATDGLLDELKKALSERMLSAELRQVADRLLVRQ